MRYKDSDITVQGSNISAQQNVTLQADDEINLLATKNTAEQHSTNKSSSASLGVSVGLSSNGVGVAVNASASQARGKADGVDAIYSNSHVDAGNTLTLQSGGDTNLKGAVVSGDKVAATIGGNLNLESLQDTSTYKSKKNSTGVSISVPIVGAGLMNAGLNASRAKATGDYASVIEQTGIQAGDQGFNITTHGNTDLKGAIIASTSKAANGVDADGKPINQLTTGTLSYTDLQNHTEASAKSDGINLTQDLLSKYGAARTAASSAHMHQNENESRSSVTQSAIEQGAINITSTQTISKNISEDNALTISRDTQNANQPLVKLDAKALEAQVAKDAQQRAADVGLVTRVTDDAYRVMFREPPRFYKATCQAGADCTKDPKKVIYEELKGTPQEIAADMLKNGGTSPVLATNGIFNGVDRAVELAFQNADLIRTDANGQPLATPIKPTSIYVMHYIPANTMIGEGLVALYEQKFASTLGYTNSDTGYADAVTAYGQGSLTLLGHSRGTIVQNNAFNILHDQGFTNNQLSVRGVGGAVPVGQFTDAAAAVLGAGGDVNKIIFNYFGNDPVPTQSFIGGNAGFSTLRDLWTVLTGPDNTQHSCYGTGAAGCTQVEIPTQNGYQGTPEGNATLYKYSNGQLINTPVNPR